MQVKSYMTGPLSVNTFLAIDEASGKAFLVDPGGEDKKLLKDVEDNNIKVEYIILTHGHGDHICGIKSYQEAWPEALVVAHESEADLLSQPNKNFSLVTCGFPVSIKPDITVKDGDEFILGESTIKFLFTPGHTPGGMSIYVKGNLFSGDTLFAGSVGRTDFPGSSFKELKKSIQEKLYVLPDETKVYPGHMGFTTIGSEKEHNPFV
jgi:hydroxyacylglutathione hydrolase